MIQHSIIERNRGGYKGMHGFIGLLHYWRLYSIFIKIWSMSFYSDGEILELLINLKYPISRGDKSVKEFLYDYYNKFIGEYKNILNSKNDITSAKSPYLKALEKALPMVEGTTKSILEVLEYYDVLLTI